MEVVLTDNSDEVKRLVNEQILAALEAVGIQAASHAQQIVTEEGRVDTGALRSSISHLVVDSEKTVYIGTNNEYAIYNELGTGIHIGGGRSTPWRYQDARGNWHTTSGMKPIHFLKNAVENNLDEYKAIVDSILRE